MSCCVCGCRSWIWRHPLLWDRVPAIQRVRMAGLSKKRWIGPPLLGGNIHLYVYSTTFMFYSLSTFRYGWPCERVDRSVEGDCMTHVRLVSGHKQSDDQCTDIIDWKRSPTNTHCNRCTVKEWVHKSWQLLHTSIMGQESSRSKEVSLSYLSRHSTQW